MPEIFGFDRFVNKRGKVNSSASPSPKLYKKYENFLPEYIIQIWRTYGFASYANGLFRMSSPDSFETVLKTFFGKDNKYIVICHSSFGDLVLWNYEDSSIISLNSSTGRGIVMAENEKKIDSFFAFVMNDDEFYEAHNYDLHLKAVKKFGQLEPDQVFAFVPALALGGSEKLENIKVSQLREYLAIIAELAVENNREAAAQDA
jgi:hypothetical protein